MHSIYRVIFIFSVLIFFAAQSQAQNTGSDSTLLALKKLPDDTSKVRQINAFLWNMKFSGINEDIVNLGENNIQLAKKLKDLQGAGTASKNIGTIYYYSGDYNTAIRFYKQSLSIYTDAEYTRGIADANRNLGNVYSQLGDWKQSLDYLFKSLAAYEEIEYSIGISGTLDAIGIVYKSSGTDENNIEKALEYFQKAVTVKEADNNERGLIASYLYIGDAYFTQMQDSLQGFEGEYDIENPNPYIKAKSDSALHYFLEAKRLNENYKIVQLQGMIFDAIGQIYLYEKKLDSAYVYFKSGLKGKEEVGNLFGIASTKTYLSKYFIETGQNDSALIYLNDALDIAKQINAGSIERDVSADLANIYMQKKEFEHSANLYQRYIQLDDSLRNEETTRRMTQLEMQYEFDKKEKLREAEARRQRIVLYFFIVGFALMVLMAVLIFRSYRIKQKANKLLEDKNYEISQKNIMLNQQNEEIEAQRDEIESQRDFVIQQRDKIAEQNKNITDSIVYAQRIQKAVLPPASYIGELLPEHFILFKPRDIVSGDFYWSAFKDKKIVITAADCTGHGVPGAFMSLLGVSFLNEIVNASKPEELHSHIILNKLRDKIKSSLRQTGGIKESKDGMDMALCVIDQQNNSLEFAGANNPLLRVRNNEITKIKGDRMPVGIHYKDEKSFTNNVSEIYPGDIFYIYSDGYIDQFGGEKRRKFMLPRFKEMILKNHKKSMQEQKAIFDTTIEDWKQHGRGNGNEVFEQIDDILVIGFKF